MRSIPASSMVVWMRSASRVTTHFRHDDGAVSGSLILDNVIDVHVSRLRRKIDADQPVRLIHTVRGVGFVLREADD